jgi:hypothetical protein
MRCGLGGPARTGRDVCNEGAELYFVIENEQMHF